MIPGGSSAARTGALYLAVVGAAAVIDLGGFVLLERAGAPIAPAAAFSFLCAAVFNYSVNARVVFRQAATSSRFLLFLAVGLMGLTVNTGVTAGAHALGAAPALAKTIGIGAAFFVNAGLNVLVVFRKPSAS